LKGDYDRILWIQSQTASLLGIAIYVSFLRVISPIEARSLTRTFLHAARPGAGKEV
jgi:hypothetical protein